MDLKKKTLEKKTETNKKYWVCKLNKTTAWVSEVYSSKILKREKGETLTKILKIINAFKVDYSLMDVEQEDLDKKPNKEDAIYLKNCCEKEVEELKIKIDKGKTGGWKNTFFCKKCSRQMNPVKVEGNKILLSSEYKMFWFDWSDKHYTFYKQIG